jgi:hypothetical protein
VTRRLSDLTSSRAVQAALDEFVRIGREAFLAKHGFGPSRRYVVIDPKTGIEADSKAIVGVAFGYQHPQLGQLKPEDFSGGDATVAPLLQGLGFRVLSIDAPTAGEDWRRDEVELIVADYLAMLVFELNGQRYSKTAHRQRLLSLLPGRSAGSVEFKHCNISAVMLELGFPYLRGYKPRVNFQRQILTSVVEDQVGRHRLLDDAALAACQQPVEAPIQPAFDHLMVHPPARGPDHVGAAPPAAERPAIHRDYLEREARNRSLGLAGETFAVDFERWRLIQLGAGQLAERVEHVSRTQGDGLGFDILSFEPDGGERHIEVKTTAFGERTPFYVSANELAFARKHEQSFTLYRLFDFRRSPRLFELPGPIERHCKLDAANFRASFGQ